MNRKPKIMIDAGHGGKDPGAVGPTGLQEKDVVLTVAMLLGGLLLSDCEVNYTRRDDTFVELAHRATKANDWQADAFISLHCNAGPPGQGTGFEVFTTVGQTLSDGLATDVFEAFGAEFPDRARRVDMRDGDVDKEQDFAVLRRTRMRAILFELEFIHTNAGENWLRDARNQARCARALAAGIRKHFFKTPDGKTQDAREEAAPLKAQLQAKISELSTLVSQL
jgi:N-acetylmuramoyl-L-alanine amidase